MADIKTQALSQDINIVAKFEKDLAPLMEMLNAADVQVLAPGAAVHIYKTAGTLPTSAVAEKALIGDAGYAPTVDKTVVLAYKKYRNLVGIETIGKFGYDVAVTKSNDSMLRDVQAGLRASIVAALATGTTTTSGATFQAAIANAWGKVNEKMCGEAGTPVFFCNPIDVAGYMGSANITVQTAFSMNYIENFMGLGNVIIDPKVTSGTVYATVCENLDIVAADVTAIEGMELMHDESGIFAVHNGAKYENGAVETVIYSGLEIFPVYADRVVKSTIASA